MRQEHCAQGALLQSRTKVTRLPQADESPCSACKLRCKYDGRSAMPAFAGMTTCEGDEPQPHSAVCCVQSSVRPAHASASSPPMARVASCARRIPLTLCPPTGLQG